MVLPEKKGDMEIKKTKTRENKMEIKIKNTDYAVDLETGFFQLDLEYKNQDYILRVCLNEKERTKDAEKRWEMVQNDEDLFKKEIDLNDLGWLDGICGDSNRDFFDVCEKDGILKTDSYDRYDFDSVLKILKRGCRLYNVRY